VRFELRSTERPVLRQHPRCLPGSVRIRVVASSICGSDLWGCGGCHSLSPGYPSCQSEEGNTGTDESQTVRDDKKQEGCCQCQHEPSYRNWRRSLEFLHSPSLVHLPGGTGHEVIGDVVEVIEPCPIPVGTRVLALPPSYVRLQKALREALRAKVAEANGRDIIDDASLAELLPDIGGFADEFITHSFACIPIPCEVPYAGFNPLWYIVAQPLATVLHACRRLETSLVGEDVAIVGQGQNGLIMTQLAAILGARRIIVLDLMQYRLGVAKQQMKATHAVQVTLGREDEAVVEVERITHSKMCDVVMDFVGHQNSTIDLCSRLVKDYGTILLFGLPPAESEPQIEISMRHFRRNLRYVTTCGPDIETFHFAMELLEQGRFDPGPLFTHRLPFEQFADAYDMASSYRDGVIKILIEH